MSDEDTKPEGVEHWRGDRYAGRSTAAKTYKQARTRVRKMKPKNWRDYLARCREFGLPTEPHKLWPAEFEAGGRYAGYLGTGVPLSDVAGMLSTQEVRTQLGLGKETCNRLLKGHRPDARVGHKKYFKVASLRAHIKRALDTVTLRSDARERVLEALPKLHA